MKRVSVRSLPPGLRWARRLAFLWGVMMIPGCGSGSEPVNPGPEPSERAAVSFVVMVPDGTPDTASVYVSGNQSVLGDWDGYGLETNRRADGVYEASAPFPIGTHLEFKITRGGWETVEKGPHGEELSNRTHQVRGRDTLRVEVKNWRDWVEGEPRPHTLTGNIRLHRNISSRFLSRPRNVIVYLPPDYNDSQDRRYPVLYMHDGQNLFDEATSFLGIEWEVDETAERLIRAKAIEPLIVVGVYNTADRIAEYTPAADPRYGGGAADDYGRFLVEELKPFVDRTYRTLADQEHTGIAGSSLGGLVSMYFALTRADTYSRIGVLSPSVWWADGDILHRVGKGGKTDTRIWLDIGTAEGSNPAESQRAVDGARALRDSLVVEGWVPGEDLRYFEDPGAAHNEAAWARRTEAVLRFLFPASP